MMPHHAVPAVACSRCFWHCLPLLLPPLPVQGMLCSCKRTASQLWLTAKNRFLQRLGKGSFRDPGRRAHVLQGLGQIEGAVTRLVQVVRVSRDLCALPDCQLRQAPAFGPHHGIVHHALCIVSFCEQLQCCPDLPTGAW